MAELRLPTEPTSPVAPRPSVANRRMVSILGIGAVVTVSLALATTGDQAALLVIGSPLVLLLAAARGGVSTVGFARPRRGFLRTVMLGLVVGTLLQLLAIVLIDPAVERLVGEPTDLSAFLALEGDLEGLLILLAVVWTLVAFGEELIFRGFLLTEVERIIGWSPPARVVNAAFGSVLFGVSHLYQGPAGMVATGVLGAVLAALFFAEGRNLWLPIVVHGAIDTVGLLLIYFGLYEQLAAW